MVPAAGFEPAPREGHEPESCASANSATGAGGEDLQKETVRQLVLNEPEAANATTPEQH